MSVFQFAEVYIGYPDLFGKLVQAYLPIRHHTVESYYYFSHDLTSDSFVVLFLELGAVFEYHRQHKDHQHKNYG